MLDLTKHIDLLAFTIITAGYFCPLISDNFSAYGVHHYRTFYEMAGVFFIIAFITAIAILMAKRRWKKTGTSIILLQFAFLLAWFFTLSVYILAVPNPVIS
ncbi:hypothetical protein H0A36_14560 [Endozoicomonas sp. SM1973]|uniref:Uncharacterized protein n=1 Tax=Spartinivicinus marinus TaxID=2994442 RepID=A0A853ICI8_9GAMM|nr:hypothetical protein [Spartinivicinus marinus]MCX4028570.1 hypothetical protein [Spartinivicinus marinus]NYZ67237.1 hypothetical protein [Spartinivicinus marinus]